MSYDIEEFLCLGFILLVCGVLVFIVFQSGKIDDCVKRGGYAVDTSAGWVCAKLERI